MCEFILYSYVVIGALVVGAFVGWALGFLHGIFWRVGK
jgi:uncharacterized membrane protein